MRLEPVEQGGAMGRGRQRGLAEPLAQRHRQEIDGLFGQRGGVVRGELVRALAELDDEIIGEPLQRHAGAE